MRLVIACYSGRESESGAKGTLSLSLVRCVYRL